MFLDEYDNLEHIVFIDTETVTDQLTNIAKLWEIGIVVIINDQIVETYESLVCPDAQFERLDIFYSEEHITIDEIKSSPKFKDIYPNIKHLLQENTVIGGHNVDYDLRVVNRELNLISQNLIGSRKVDTMRMSRKLFPEQQNHKLDDLCRKYNLNIDNRHRALDDIKATAEAYIEMKNDFKKIKEGSQNITGGLF